MSSKKNLPKINHQISSEFVRLIDQTGNMLGVVSLEQATESALEVKLDLVEICFKDEQEVCKIMNFSKYRYEVKKQIHESKKKQKVSVVKEIKFKPNIGRGDFSIKDKKIREFLEEGNKVKVSMIFRGREIIHHQNGLKLIEELIGNLSDIGKTDNAPKLEGKQIITTLLPIAIKP